MQNSKVVGVLTTINHPNAGMRALEKFASQLSTELVVVGDQKTPESWFKEDCCFLSLNRQHEEFSEFANIIPVNHYARKNIGYLKALKFNPEWVYETDDDNIPLENPFASRTLAIAAEMFESESKWLNIYEAFGYSPGGQGRKVIWPRGFDLRSLHAPLRKKGFGEVIAPLQQGLADGDPDVDAIYRLVTGELVCFERRSPIALGAKQVCPTNSQTTWWHESIFQLLYLPTTCTFRLTDILRGFVAWRIIQSNQQTVSFHAPLVKQERNDHDLIRDFEDEVGLYLHSDSIVSDLMGLNLDALGLGDKMLACYRVFADYKLVEMSELSVLERWNEEF